MLEEIVITALFEPVPAEGRYFYSGNAISSRVELRVSRMSIDGSSHSVSIILANKNSWKIPQLYHVPGFGDLALGRCTITVQSEAYVLLPSVLVGERYPGSNWYLIITGSNTNTNSLFPLCFLPASGLTWPPTIPSPP